MSCATIRTGHRDSLGRIEPRWPVLPAHVEIVTVAGGRLTTRPTRGGYPIDAPSPVTWQPRAPLWRRLFAGR